jgi:hypothetical protein
MPAHRVLVRVNVPPDPMADGLQVVHRDQAAGDQLPDQVHERIDSVRGIDDDDRHRQVRRQ